MQLAYVDPQSYHGLAKYDAGFLRGLCESDFEGEIRFYCSYLLDQPIPDNVEVTPVFQYNLKRNAITKLLSYMTSMLRILVAAFTGKVDIYHFQWFKFPLVDLLCVIFLQRLARTQVVFTAHNVVPHGATTGRHWLLGKIYRTVDHIIVHNSSTAEEISRRFSVEPDRFSVLPHGIINLESKGTPSHQQQVNNFVKSHDTCFLFLGRGSYYKGLDILLKAWPEASLTSVSNIGLIVMGAVDDELKKSAKQAASVSKDTVLLVDEYVSEADLFQAVQACDVVVLPYRTISQSGVLLSVLGLGVPVLVSSQPGLLEPLALAPVGWQFDGTEAGLSEQLKFLGDNPQVISGVRDKQQYWDTVADAYNWKTIGCSNATLYRKLVMTPPRGITGGY